MLITLAGRIESGDELLENDLRQLSVIQTDAGAMLYAATGLNGGISIWNLGGTLGDVTLENSVYYGVSALSLGTFTALETRDTARIILAGSETSQLVFHPMSAQGGLGPADTLRLPGASSVAPDVLTALALNKGQAALYGIDATTGTLKGWRLDKAGEADSLIRLKGKPADYRLDEGTLLATTSVGGRDFLLAGDATGVMAYAVHPGTGALQATGALGTAQGIGIAAPTALAAVSAFGGTWVLLAAAGSQTLTVMALAADGTLSPADHVLDTLATRFGGVAALEVVQTGDHVLVLAGGADDGLSLFTLLPGGRLVHLQSLTHETGLGLENVSGIESLISGDQLRLFVTSTSTPGVTELTLSLAELGELIRPEQTEAAARGTAGNDLILSPEMRRDLDGGPGQDVLVSGGQGGVLTGGEGRDTFVISASNRAIVITDFEIGLDRLDLSTLPGLRSPDQIKSTIRETMIILEYAGTTIRVETGDARARLEDLFPGGTFESPDRLPFPTGPIGRFTEGSRRDDRLNGQSGTDIMTGRGGDDRLLGRGGDDDLAGNRGADLIRGHAGEDRLRGQEGRDTLLGGIGADTLIGNGGRDRLNGQKGDDRLQGGAGADEFRFVKAHGADRITDFEPGRDVIALKTRADDFSALSVLRQGGDTLIDTGSGSLLLEDLTPRALSEEDFIFL